VVARWPTRRRLRFHPRAGKIVTIDVPSDPARIAQVELTLLDE
jgi:hypothetical protein